jgi:hypothetical protein
MMRSPRLDMALIEYDERHLLDEGLYNWGADVVVLDRPTLVERETLTRDLLPGGLVIEVDAAAGLLRLTPRDGESSARPLGDSLADGLAGALEPMLAGLADLYNVRNAVVGHSTRPG